MNRTHHRKRAALVGAGTLTLAAIGSVAYGAIPAADGTIHACRATKDPPVLTVTIDGSSGAYQRGDVRVVDEGEACKSYEAPISWNQKGVKGDQGEPGSDGVDGLNGLDGRDGTDGRDGQSCTATNPDGSLVQPACRGPQGAAGIASEVYIARDSNGFNASSGQHANTHTTVTVPAGSYLVAGKAVLLNGDGDRQPADCRLSTGDVTFLQVESKVQDSPSSSNLGWEAVSVLDAASFAGTTVVAMDCHIFSGGIRNIVLTATRVGAVH